MAQFDLLGIKTETKHLLKQSECVWSTTKWWKITPYYDLYGAWAVIEQ
jgi:hypothetical protein